MIQAVPPLSMPWFRGDDYASVRDLCPDLPQSFEEWEGKAAAYYEMACEAFPLHEIKKVILAPEAIAAFAAEIGVATATREMRSRLAAKIAEEQFCSPES